MTYQHLSQDERYQIYALLKAGHAISRIAEIIGRHKSTISRELTRNVGLKGYRPQQAQRFAELRGRNSRNARRVSASEWSLAEQLLVDKWSPEQVASQVCMSHETITEAGEIVEAKSLVAGQFLTAPGVSSPAARSATGSSTPSSEKVKSRRSSAWLSVRADTPFSPKFLARRPIASAPRSSPR